MAAASSPAWQLELQERSRQQRLLNEILALQKGAGQEASTTPSCTSSSSFDDSLPLKVAATEDLARQREELQRRFGTLSMQQQQLQQALHEVLARKGQRIPPTQPPNTTTMPTHSAVQPPPPQEDPEHSVSLPLHPASAPTTPTSAARRVRAHREGVRLRLQALEGENASLRTELAEVKGLLTDLLSTPHPPKSKPPDEAVWDKANPTALRPPPPAPPPTAAPTTVPRRAPQFTPPRGEGPLSPTTDYSTQAPLPPDPDLQALTAAVVSLLEEVHGRQLVGEHDLASIIKETTAAASHVRCLKQDLARAATATAKNADTTRAKYKQLRDQLAEKEKEVDDLRRMLSGASDVCEGSELPDPTSPAPEPPPTPPSPPTPPPPPPLGTPHQHRQAAHHQQPHTAQLRRESPTDRVRPAVSPARPSPSFCRGDRHQMLLPPRERPPLGTLSNEFNAAKELLAEFDGMMGKLLEDSAQGGPPPPPPPVCDAPKRDMARYQAAHKRLQLLHARSASLARARQKAQGQLDQLLQKRDLALMSVRQQREALKKSTEWWEEHKAAMAPEQLGRYDTMVRESTQQCEEVSARMEGILSELEKALAAAKVELQRIDDAETEVDVQRREVTAVLGILPLP